MRYVLVLLFLLAGCDNLEPPQNPNLSERANYTKNYELPATATHILEHGNGWVTFEWQGRPFLYQFQGTHGGHSAVTLLNFMPEASIPSQGSSQTQK
jgi:hypothetical protein